MNVYDLSRVKTVVADSNRYTQRLMCAILMGLQMPTPMRASCGETALEHIATSRPHLLITEWDMEPMTGLELIRAVRDEKTSRSATIPIIVATGHTALERITEARDAGANEFLAKPVSIDAVYQRIVALIERPRPYIRLDSYFGPDRRRKIEDFGADERRHVDLALVMKHKAAG